MKPTAVVGAVSSAGVRTRNPCFHFPCFLSSASVSETSQMGALTHTKVRTPETAQVHSHVRAVPASHAIYIHLVACSRPGGSICASERPQGTPRHPGRDTPNLPPDLRPGTYP